MQGTTTRFRCQEPANAEERVERVQRGSGPLTWQPYGDLYKLAGKELVVPATASWVFWAAPVVARTAMRTVPILIPVLTNYPLPLPGMGGLVGGGLILTLDGFGILLAGLDSGHPYGGLGSSRAARVYLTELARAVLSRKADEPNRHDGAPMAGAAGSLAR